MKKTELKKVEKYFCDSCEKMFTNQFISFDMINDLHMRILEMKPQSMNNHYTYGRKTWGSCSTECAVKFLNKEMIMFVKEITATKSTRK